MKTWLRLTLITMTVGGGFLGVVVITPRLFTWGNDGFQLSFAIFLVFLGLYVFVVASGLVFVADPRKTQLLVWALAMQIPWVSSPLLIYRMAAGAYVTVTAGQTEDSGRIGFHLFWTLGSNFQCYLLKQAAPWSLGVNFVALALLILLVRSREREASAGPLAAPTSESEAIAVP
jgi:hypothetical protein